MNSLIHKKRLLLGVFITSILLFVTVSYAVTAVRFANALGSKNKIVNYNKKGVVLTDRNGTPFFTFYNGRPYEYIPLNEIPDLTQKAFIAAEDKDFYHHNGFSVSGIARSAYLNSKDGEVVTGGSTITQQLVKNTLLNSRVSFVRKYEELLLAQIIEAKYSKSDILEMYLNSIYFGEGSYGIKSAANSYFGTDPRNLTLAQSSFVAGILPAPTRLSPFNGHLDQAYQRQSYVLGRMVEQKYIDSSQMEEAKNVQLSFKGISTGLNTNAPHFALMIIESLNKKYGAEYLQKSGYTVQTTIDLSWQKMAEDTLKDQIDNFWQRELMNGAVVATDQQSGEILVYVGSKEWNDDTFGKMDMAKSPRSPGSSFKPIIYAKALEEGEINMATVLKDSPTVFDGGYKPVDYDRKYRGNVLVRRALANSLNIPSVQVMQSIGIEDGVEMAKNLGITTLPDDLSQYGLSFVLGSKEVPLTQMVQAYSAFGNDGVLNPSHSIISIQNKYGEEVERPSFRPKSVLDSRISFLITSILSDSKARREAFGTILDTNFPAAVKTGTSEDYKDSLTVGYTPDLTLGVWIGRNDNKPMDGVAGSVGAAPIWKKLMAYYNENAKRRSFLVPDGIVRATTCGYSIGGSTRIATRSAVVNEYFLEDALPENSNCKVYAVSNPLSPTSSPAQGGADFQAAPSPSLTPEPTVEEDPTHAEENPTPTERIRRFRFR